MLGDISLRSIKEFRVSLDKSISKLLKNKFHSHKKSRKCLRNQNKCVGTSSLNQSPCRRTSLGGARSATKAVRELTQSSHQTPGALSHPSMALAPNRTIRGTALIYVRNCRHTTSTRPSSRTSRSPSCSPNVALQGNWVGCGGKVSNMTRAVGLTSEGSRTGDLRAEEEETNFLVQTIKYRNCN